MRRACALSRWRGRRWAIGRKLAKDAPGDRADARAVGAVPAVRLPAHTDLPRARRLRMSPAARTGCGGWRGCRCPRSGAARRVAASRPRPCHRRGRTRCGLRLRVRPCANGQQFKCLTVDGRVDQGGPGHRRRRSIRSPRVIEVLSQLVSERGAPRYLRSDNGPEFVSSRSALDRRTGDRNRADRARQAVAERHRRELQRQVPRRVPEHGMVSFAGRGEGGDRELAAALQLLITTHISLCR